MLHFIDYPYMNEKGQSRKGFAFFTIFDCTRAPRGNMSAEADGKMAPLCSIGEL